jgi:rhodanese-related sulfurtransferase
MKEWLLKLSTPKKLALLAFILGLAAFLIGNPSQNRRLEINATELAMIVQKEVDHVNVSDLADWLIKEKSDFRLIDMRTGKEFNEYHIPSAENFPITNLLESGLGRNEKILLYSEGGIHSAQAWFLLKSNNFKNIYILRGGLDSWKDEILFPKISAEATAEQKAAFEKAKQVSLYFGGNPQLVSGEQTTSVSAIQPSTSPQLPKNTSPTPKVGGALKKKKEGC